MISRKTFAAWLAIASLASAAWAEDLSKLDPLVADGSEKQWKAASKEAEETPRPAGLAPASAGYVVGVNDVIDVAVLQPDPLTTSLTVSPDGTVTFPYAGNILVKGKSLIQIQNEIQMALSDYMKYPLVSVSLKESRSQMLYVYGEVVRPGAYPLQEGLTVMRAISLAGGFSKFGSASRVKILRSGSGGDETIKVDLKRAMDGDQRQDVKIMPGDVVTVSEGVF